MNTNKLSRREVLLLTLPTMGLAALGFSLSMEEAPPVLEQVSMKRLTPSEKEFLLDQTLNTRVTARIRYAPPFRHHLLGGEEPSVEIVETSFHDQASNRIELRQDQNFMVSDPEDDVYEVTYDFAVSHLPESVKQLTIRMHFRIADKWTLPVSAVVYKR